MSAEAANTKGRSPLHEFARFIVFQLQLTNLSVRRSNELIQRICWVRFTEKNAVEMLELFLECMPEYNIDRPDGDGKLFKIYRYS